MSGLKEHLTHWLFEEPATVKIECRTKDGRLMTMELINIRSKNLVSLAELLIDKGWDITLEETHRGIRPVEEASNG